MDYDLWIVRASEYVKEAGLEDHPLTTANFLDYTEVLKDIITSWSRQRIQNEPGLLDFTTTMKMLRDDFGRIVESDPGIIYKPQHHVALAFHKSLAFYRYNHSGNRTGKTQGNKQEDRWFALGNHPYRVTPPLPVSVAIVSYNYSDYATKVFEPKFITGEAGNPLAPLFPEGGRWFNHYDSRKRILRLACPACANAGKPMECKHPKSDISLYSNETDSVNMAGTAFGLVDFDEHVRKEFFSEAKKRLLTVKNSSFIMSETPKKGKAFWTYKEFIEGAKKGQMRHGSNIPLIDVFNIDTISAGIADEAQVRDDIATSSPAEVRCCIYGEPMVWSEHSVFDTNTITEMRRFCRPPLRGHVRPAQEDTKVPIFVEEGEGPVRIWEMPQPGEQYLLSADVAQGLTGGDFSSGSVLKINLNSRGDFEFVQVAAYHGHINPVPYATALNNLGRFYNTAIISVERNGPGISTIYELAYNLIYPALFRDMSSPAQAGPGVEAQFGITTDKTNKSVMISFLQNAIHRKADGARTIQIFCDDTLTELESYTQTPTPSGLSFRFENGGGGHDDRVMSLAVGIYTILTNPYLFDPTLKAQQKQKEAMEKMAPRERDFWSQMGQYSETARQMRENLLY